MAWIEPKINWNENDGLTAADMNRIEGNMKHAMDLVVPGKLLVKQAILDKNGNVLSEVPTHQELADGVASIITDPSIGTTDAVAGDIITGKKVVSQGNLLTGTLALSGTSVDANVLAGTTYYNTDPKTKRTGSMVNRGKQTGTITTQGGKIFIGNGYHDGSGFIEYFDPNHVAANIKKGAKVGGVDGAYGGEQLSWKLMTFITLETVTFTNACCYGKGIFIAVARNSNGDNIIYRTTNQGDTWTNHTIPVGLGISFIDICYGNNMFVAVGGIGYVYTSTDGIAWTKREAPNMQQLYGVAYCNGIFIAGGQNGDTIYSTDGISWIKSTKFATIRRAAYGNGIWVVAMDNVIYTSSDSVNWSTKSFSFGANGPSLSFGNGTFFAIGNSKMYKSTDGVNWTAISGDIKGADGANAIYVNGIWYTSGVVFFTNNYHIGVSKNNLTSFVLDLETSLLPAGLAHSEEYVFVVTRKAIRRSAI